MKPSELREKTPQELKKLEVELQEELFRLKIKKSTGQLEKTHRLSLIKTDLARLFTLKAQKAAEGKRG